jgi:hypothetical protein
MTDVIIADVGLVSLPFAGAVTLGIRGDLFDEMGLRSRVPVQRGDRPLLADPGDGALPASVRPGGHAAPADRPAPRQDLGKGGARFGLTQAPLYRRFQHAGMPQDSAGEALAAWRTLLWAPASPGSRNRKPGPAFGVAMRLGRLLGSVRYGVPCF